MLVLAIDTSTPVITAGVVQVKRPHEVVAELESTGGVPDRMGQQGGHATLSPADLSRVLAEQARTDAFGHAEHLMPMVTEALAEAGHRLTDLEAITVGVGPGPFTGLRVGMATAAALGDALDVPVHGVPSHDAMADAAAHAGDFLVVTDARRKEVYVSGYAESMVRAFGPQIVRPTDLAGLVAGMPIVPEWVTGAGAGLVVEALGLPVRPIPGSVSAGLVRQAVPALLTGVVPGPLTPLYLRRPDATEPHAPKPVLPTDQTAAGR